MEFYAALDTLSSQQRQQFELSVPESSWAWLWNLPEVLEPVLTPESESVEEPPEESPTQDPIWSEVVLEVGSAIPILKSGAGVAAVISLPDRTLVISAYLGDVSKEVANYQALIAGLKRAIQFGCKRLVVKISSFTLCRAFTGFTPQKPDSVALHQQALALLAQLASYRFEDQKRTIAEGFALSAVQEHHLAAES